MFTHTIKFDEYTKQYKCIFESNIKLLASQRIAKEQESKYFNSQYMLNITFKRSIMYVSIGQHISEIEEQIIGYIL